MPAATRPVRALLLGLYACEAGAAGFLLGLRKLAGAPWWRFGDRIAIGAAAALALGVAGALLVARALRREGASRRVKLTLLLNLFTVGLLLLAGEVALRILAAPTPRSVRILGTELLPYSWTSLREHHRANIERASGDDGSWAGSFLVHDPELGWTVGASRSSPARASYSSAEGLRSPAAGLSYAERAAGKRIVALVGDSYTFALDVTFEQSWAARLQERLGDAYLVLNFGVDGYGVDQAYLRYVRDVVPWKPEVVVFGAIQHDFWRTIVAYPFLAFPTWQIPFSKPRFELDGDNLRLRNVPLPSPSENFRRDRITALPHLDLESAFVAGDWEPSLCGASLAARLVLTKFRPAPPDRGPQRARDFRALNRAIVRAFHARCAAEGSHPVFVYFPTEGGGDFPDAAAVREEGGWARGALDAEGLPYLDLTPNLRVLPAGRRLLPEGHYTPEGNAVVADGIHEHLRELLR